MAFKVKQSFKKLVVSSDDQHLHEDLVINILLRLPIKSITRFKSVCKNWNSLIKNPDFITNHYHHPNNHSTIIVRRSCDDFSSTWSFNFCHHRHFCRDKTPRVSSLDPYMLNASRLNEIVGPVNGLFLLFKIPDPPTLWNPATREFKPLPPLPDSSLDRYTFGFGIDPLTNLLKIIWIIWKEISDYVYDVYAYLYTLGNGGNGSWRKLHLVGDWLYCHMYWVCPSLSNAYLDGVYYWVAEADEPSFTARRYIICFDMKDEVFRKMNVPDYIFTNHHSQRIGSYKDRLAMFVYPPVSETLIEIWVMESVGYWTKQFTLGPIFFKVMRALGFSDNGLVFLGVGDNELSGFPRVIYELVLYDPIRNQELTKIGAGLVGDHPSVVNYKESLVSLIG